MARTSAAVSSSSPDRNEARAGAAASAARSPASRRTKAAGMRHPASPPVAAELDQGPIVPMAAHPRIGRMRALLWAALFFAGMAQAQAPQRITVGYYPDARPFTYENESG